MPGDGDLPAGRPAGGVGGVHRKERGVFQKVGRIRHSENSMKRFMLTAALLLVAAGCKTENSNPQAAANPPQPVVQASAKPINTHCAVDKGDDVDPKVTYLYQGK